NVNQTCFETLTKIVQRDLLAGLIDTHGRNHLRLSLYSLSIRSNPDLPSLSLSSEDEMALSANGGLISTSLFPFYHLFSLLY
ncbi:unnamed protein product, partial [Rotaria sp. Silwood2]